MTPTIQQILMGVGAALSAPPPPEAAGDFNASKVGMIGMMSMLAAQEADKAIPVRVAENAAIRLVLRRAAGTTYDAEFAGRISAAVDQTDEMLTISALDAANADLRRLLTDLHASVEASGDREFDHAILRLYRDMAEGRRLEFGR
ncbi:MAG: hypothetical protein U1E50_00280 [Caulobacteraceae bacterium]